jgi:hypothetical protein
MPEINNARVNVGGSINFTNGATSKAKAASIPTNGNENFIAIATAVANQILREALASGMLDDTDHSVFARLDKDNNFNGVLIGNARAPVVEVTKNYPLSCEDKTAYINVTSDQTVYIVLPNDWKAGEGCIIRRCGTGDVQWLLQSGASAPLSESRAGHTKIAEQHCDLFVRVISNSTGTNAVWAVEGFTS